MAGLNPDDLRVEVLVGRVGPEGDVQVLAMEPREQRGTVFLFMKEVRPILLDRVTQFALKYTF